MTLRGLVRAFQPELEVAVSHDVAPRVSAEPSRASTWKSSICATENRVGMPSKRRFGRVYANPVLLAFSLRRAVSRLANPASGGLSLGFSQEDGASPLAEGTCDG